MSVPQGVEILVMDDSLYGMVSADYLEKGPDVKYSVAEKIKDATRLMTSDFYDESELFGEPESKAYALKLDVASLRVHYVSGIKFSTVEFGVPDPVFEKNRRQISRFVSTNIKEPEFRSSLRKAANF